MANVTNLQDREGYHPRMNTRNCTGIGAPAGDTRLSDGIDVNYPPYSTYFDQGSNMSWIKVGTAGACVWAVAPGSTLIAAGKPSGTVVTDPGIIYPVGTNYYDITNHKRYFRATATAGTGLIGDWYAETDGETQGS